MGDITASGVSLGGLTVGLAILCAHIALWYFGQSAKLSVFKKLKSGWKDLLIPFSFLVLFGSLIVLSVGGYVGDAAGITLWGQNKLGDFALEEGMGGNSPDVTRQNSISLSDGGRSVVLIMIVVMVIYYLRRVRGQDWKGQLEFIAPIFCGISLGLSDGWAGWVSETLGPIVDDLGGGLAGML